MRHAFAPSPTFRRSLFSVIFIWTCWLPTLAHAEPVPVAETFQVNSVTTAGQYTAQVGTASNGDFVISWESGSSPGDDNDYAILARRFSSDGAAIGDEFQVNSYTTGTASSSSLAVTSDGDFLVVWSNSIDGSTEIRSQLYLSDGTAVGGEFTINSYTTGQQYRTNVVATSSGEFIVAWASVGSDDTDTNGASIQVRRLASDGSFIGSQFQANVLTTDTQSIPKLALQANGDFVVTWQSAGDLDGSGSSIQLRRFASDGTALGDEVFVNAYTTSDQRQPAIAADASGNFIIVWESTGSDGGDGDGMSVQGQRFDSAGAAIGAQMQINTYTTADQKLVDVVMSSGGELVVIWNSESADSGDDGSIQARLFDAEGEAVGDQVQVSSTPILFGYSPSGSPIGDEGELVVAWASYSSVGDDNDQASIQARILDIAFDISGLAWFDSDLDGIRDDGEPLLENISVSLFDAGGALIDTTTTDVSGAFTFANRTGNFYVEFEAPSEYSFTSQNAGADDDVDSDVDPTTGQTEVFSASDQTAWHAGLANGIGDRVWLDENRNGVQDASESGVEGVQVELLDEFAAVLDTSTTDVDGRYAFTDLTPATYAVRFTAPSGFDFTAQSQGGDGDLDSDIDPETGESTAFAFANGDIILDLDAGIKEQAFFEDGFESGDTSAWSRTVP